MIPKTIVVGVDFSTHSEAAVTQAVDLARLHGAKLILAHAGVVPEPAVDVSAELSRAAGEWQQVLRDDLEEKRRALASLRERYEGQGVTVSHVVVDDLPDAALVKAAEEFGADLVVVGSRGHTGMSRLLLGSVAERVVRHADAHVMVARPGTSARGGFRRVLVPTDFSDIADRAFAVAAEMLAPGGVIEAVHCWQLPPVASGHTIPPLGTSALDHLRGDIERRVDGVAERALAPHRERGLQIEFKSIEGTPTTAIVEAADASEADAIVMGSHGRRGLGRFFLGSVAETTVRYAQKSVVVVHGDKRSG